MKSTRIALAARPANRGCWGKEVLPRKSSPVGPRFCCPQNRQIVGGKRKRAEQAKWLQRGATQGDLGGQAARCWIRICPVGTFRWLEPKAGHPEVLLAVFMLLPDCRFARESNTLSSRDRFAGWLGWGMASWHIPWGDGTKGVSGKPCPGCPIHQEHRGQKKVTFPKHDAFWLSHLN